ncbi:MAG: UTP--glucose-1-phosphate uridylyltransferase GalU, partial [Mycoplasma sp.]
MSKVTKAVIPAAGYGTRFLPASKTIPKEMFPIIDKPTIHMIVEEAYKSGITDLLFIISRNKHSLMNYFDYNKELNDILIQKNKSKELKLINEPADLMNIQFVIQKEQLGLGHAILTAETFTNGEPFAVLLGDDIVISGENQKAALQECIEAYEKYNTSIIGVQEVNKEDVDKYGIIKPSKKLDGNLMEIDDLVEKPNVKDAPSNFAISGRYILTNDIFEVLKKTPKDIRNEIELTDALRTLNKTKKMIAQPFSGRRFDIGQKKGYVEATIYLALRDKDISE